MYTQIPVNLQEYADLFNHRTRLKVLSIGHVLPLDVQKHNVSMSQYIWVIYPSSAYKKT